MKYNKTNEYNQETNRVARPLKITTLQLSLNPHILLVISERWKSVTLAITCERIQERDPNSRKQLTSRVEWVNSWPMRPLGRPFKNADAASCPPNTARHGDAYRVTLFRRLWLIYCSSLYHDIVTEMLHPYLLSRYRSIVSKIEQKIIGVKWVAFLITFTFLFNLPWLICIDNCKNYKAVKL